MSNIKNLSTDYLKKKKSQYMRMEFPEKSQKLRVIQNEILNRKKNSLFSRAKQNSSTSDIFVEVYKDNEGKSDASAKKEKRKSKVRCYSIKDINKFFDTETEQEIKIESKQEKRNQEPKITKFEIKLMPDKELFEKFNHYRELRIPISDPRMMVVNDEINLRKENYKKAKQHVDTQQDQVEKEKEEIVIKRKDQIDLKNFIKKCEENSVAKEEKKKSSFVDSLKNIKGVKF